MGKVLENFENKMRQAVIAECEAAKKNVKNVKSNLNLHSIETDPNSILISPAEKSADGVNIQKIILLSRNDVINIGNSCGVAWDNGFEKNKVSILNKAGNIEGFGEAYAFHAEGLIFKRSHGTIFTSVGIIHIPAFKSVQKLTYSDLCCSSLLKNVSMNQMNIIVTYGDIVFIQAGNYSYEYLLKIKRILLMNNSDAKSIYFGKFCQLIEKIASLSGGGQYEKAYEVYQNLVGLVRDNPYNSYFFSSTLPSSILEAMFRFEEAASVSGLTPEQIEKIKMREAEYRNVLHQNNIEEAQAYYAQHEYSKALTYISKGLQTASEEVLWQLLENTIREYAAHNNEYLFEQIDQILSSAKEGDLHKDSITGAAACICRNDAAKEFQEKHYRKSLQILLYTMRRKRDCDNWRLIRKIAENADINDCEFLNELINSIKELPGATEYNDVCGILAKRCYDVAESEYASENWQKSIDMLSRSLQYTENQCIWDMINRMIDDSTISDTDLLFSNLESSIMKLSIDNEEKKKISVKMSERLYSESEDSFRNQDFPTALHKISSALGKFSTSKYYQLYASIVIQHASEKNDYLNSDVKFLLRTADTESSSFSFEQVERLNKLNDIYQSLIFKTICEQIKNGEVPRDVDKIDCMNYEDKFGMTIAMYAALYRNTELINYIVRNIGNPAEFEHKNVFDMDFEMIACFAYNSSLLDEIGELFEWYVDFTKNYNEQHEYFRETDRSLRKKQKLVSSMLSSAKRQNNFSVIDECHAAWSKLDDEIQYNMTQLEDAEIKYNKSINNWYRTVKKNCWGTILKYAILDFKEMIDSDSNNVVKLALNEFIDDYLRDHLTEKGEFETKDFYHKRIEIIKKEAKEAFEKDKKALVESFIHRSNEKVEQYNLPIELSHQFIESKIEHPVILGKYNADEQLFAIEWSGFEIKYCGDLFVPIEVAPLFKQSFSNGFFMVEPQGYAIEELSGATWLNINCSVEFEEKRYAYKLLQKILLDL